jgi:hypothetical protein
MPEEATTEEQWLKSRDPGRMLDYHKPNDKGRKARLFKCACCYLMWPLLVDERSREGVRVAERYADATATDKELKRAIADVEAAAALVERRRRGKKVSVGLFWARKAAAKLAVDTTTNNGFWAAGVARWIRHPAEGGGKSDPTFPPSPLPISAPGKTQTYLYRWLAHLVRDIFGNPFRPVAFSPEWRTSTAVTLARQMYDARDFSAMPILADALQDAGCDSDDVLTHCRGEGPHVRGCWACDLVLGKD